MKALLFTLCLLAKVAFAASPLQLQPWETGTTIVGSGTAVYALSSALTGTASSAVDLDGYSGAFVQVTSNGKVQGVSIWVSHDNSTYTKFTDITYNGSHFVPKSARYMKFVVPPSGAPTGQSTVRYSLVIESAGATASAPSYSVPILSPSSLASITLTGTTSWTYTQVTCTAQPCNIMFYNQSADTLVWWLDSSTSTPAFAGISVTAGTVPIIVDVKPTDVFHWRWDAATGNGFLQHRY